MSNEKNRKPEQPVKAAALQYEHGKDAVPRLTAKGAGVVAEKIIALAREHDVPITSDPDLFTLLAKLDIGEHIHPDLYEIVAELLVFIYKLKQEWQEQQDGAGAPEKNAEKPLHKSLPEIDQDKF
jgi:flagellar biosynthesis protein